MKLAFCIIVKDDTELQMLKDSVKSVAPYMDYVYITANGKKVDGIKAYCKKHKHNYSYIKWTGDFSEARNFNFSQVAKDVDYIYWQDTDDILVGGEHLRKVAQEALDRGKDIVFFTYWYACTFSGNPAVNNVVSIDMQHLRERLIKPGTCKWKGRLHETPVPIEGQKYNQTAYSYKPRENRFIAVMHTEDGSRLEAKMERNKQLLEKQLGEERSKGEADPRTLLYLLKIYAEQNNRENWIKGIKMGEEYLKKSGWDEERGVCWEQMSICYGRLGERKKVVTALHRAIEEWPHQPLFYLRLATAYYNLNRFLEAKHWLYLGTHIEISDYSGNMVNFKAMKVNTLELELKLAYNVKKDPTEALKFAKLLERENPSSLRHETVLFLEDMKDLNDNSRRLDLFLHYLDDIGEGDRILKIIEELPQPFPTQPFILSHVRRHLKPRKWEKNEICYFANFGAKHFEKWDEKSLSKGIGGSETAVIKLTERWAKMGYKVTVYGDPEKKHTTNGVTWLPWYYFNSKDKFNMFIQWRNPYMAGKIKAKKFYVDLHDVFAGVDYTEEMIKNIDKVFVKSKYHRNLAPNIPDDKIVIISNGI